MSDDTPASEHTEHVHTFQMPENGTLTLSLRTNCPKPGTVSTSFSLLFTHNRTFTSSLYKVIWNNYQHFSLQTCADVASLNLLISNRHRWQWHSWMSGRPIASRSVPGWETELTKCLRKGCIRKGIQLKTCARSMCKKHQNIKNEQTDSLKTLINSL